MKQGGVTVFSWAAGLVFAVRPSDFCKIIVTHVDRE
jgi:hypothetical protein